jgi:chemotaxis protein CheZ
MFPQRPVFAAELKRLKQPGITRLNGNHGPPALAVEQMPVSMPAPGLPSAEVDALRQEIKTLGSKIDSFITADHTEIDRVRQEVQSIAERINSTKKEIASLRHPLTTANDDKFAVASTELGAVVKVTEEATNNIMRNAEKVDEIVQEVRTHLKDSYAASQLQEVSDLIVNIFESCTFQDLTGQRITKVVKTLEYIEKRVDTMMEIWGKKEFEAQPLPPDITKVDGDLKLHGPQEKAEAISQSDIDKLFD